MEAVRNSETSVNFNVTTRRYIPEDSKLPTRRRENLKSHKTQNLFSNPLRSFHVPLETVILLLSRFPSACILRNLIHCSWDAFVKAAALAH